MAYLKYVRYSVQKRSGEVRWTMRSVHYDSYTEARTHLKDLLDAAARGRAATIRRESTTAAVVDADRLRGFLAALSPVRAQVVAEVGVHSGSSHRR